MSDELNIIFPEKIGPYVFQGPIGEGAFSIVKLVQNEETKDYFACKVVPRSRLHSSHLRQRFEAEIRINQQLHFPGIVEMYDLLSDDKNYYIVMEFCPNGELFQYIVDRNRLAENEAKPIFRQILETLEYIHSMNVSHRDMKPENLLIDQFGHIKISDFGLSRFIKSSGLVDTPCGSPCYASPECISGKPYNGITTDIWSSGVILYAMLTGQLPWTKRNQAQLFQQIKKGEYVIPGFLTEDCADFLRRLLTVDYKQRITIPEAYKHPWLEKSPPIFANMPTPNSTVSIRKVDEFFGRVFSKLDIPAEVLERNTTTSQGNFTKALHEILSTKSDNNNKMLFRKRKKKISRSAKNVADESVLSHNELTEGNSPLAIDILSQQPQHAETSVSSLAYHKITSSHGNSLGVPNNSFGNRLPSNGPTRTRHIPVHHRRKSPIPESHATPGENPRPISIINTKVSNKAKFERLSSRPRTSSKSRVVVTRPQPIRTVLQK